MRPNLGMLTLALGLTLLVPPQARAEERPVLTLTLDEVVERALKNNADLAVERLRPELSQTDVTAAEGAYDPFLSVDLTRSSSTTPARDAFSGAAKTNGDSYAWNFGASKNFEPGTSVTLDFDNSRATTDYVFAAFNPSFSSTLKASVTQPLARNFRIDSNRQRLRVAKISRQISDAQFRQVVMNTVASAKKLYYDLLFSIDNLEAQRKSLALAKKLLDENQIRVKVGTLAPLDVVAAESEVAGREEAVIVAENGLRESEDALKRVIFPGNDPAIWPLRLEPQDRATAEFHPIDAEAAVRQALDKRQDIAVARKTVESNEVSLQFARNQLLPQVNLVGTYSTAGQGGTQLQRADPTDPTSPIVRQIPGGYGNTLSDVFGRDFPTWSLGVSLSYPLRNRQAQAGAARARLAREQAEASLRRLELQVASEVRSAARAVETNFKRVESTRAARTLQARRLDAEEKRFAAGMSTNFLVTQAQRDLAVAEASELRAISDYRKSQIEFERVQESGGGGL